MNNESQKWLLEGIRALGGEFEYSPSTETASLLLEPATATMLGIPELAAVNFNQDAPENSVTNISALKSKFEQIAITKGSSVSVRFDPDPSVVWPSQKKASLALSSVNGKVIFNEARITDQSYAIFYCRSSVISDEKRLLLTGAAVNCSSFAIALNLSSELEQNLEIISRNTKPAAIPAHVSGKLSDTLYSMLQIETQQQLTDFHQSINKRIERDAARLYGYYNELYETARKPSGRKKIDPYVIKINLDAITSEYCKKIDDLRIKYITTISMEPVCVLWITMPCQVAWFDIFMGNKKLQKSVAWNPVSARYDSTACDCCSKPVNSSHICRNLHWLCDSCWKSCPKCGRDYCVVCRPVGCSCEV